MKNNIFATIAFLFTVLFLGACSAGPQPIQFGSDNCDFCKMTIVDEHFGCELVTKKGKAYKFDDMHCLAEFLREGTVTELEIRDIYFIDFAHPTEFFKASEAYLLYGGDIKSPMASGIASFQQADSLQKYQEFFKAKEIKWEDYINGHLEEEHRH